MNTDNFIQGQIESQQEISGPDADAYRIVFKSLKQEPNLKLSKDFALKVSVMASSKKSFNWDYFMLAAAGFGFAAALTYALVLVKPTFSAGIFTFISGYQGLISFGIIFILLLNVIEKKLIKPSHS